MVCPCVQRRMIDCDVRGVAPLLRPSELNLTPEFRALFRVPHKA